MCQSASCDSQFQFIPTRRSTSRGPPCRSCTRSVRFIGWHTVYLLVVKKHDALSQRREFSDFGSEWICEARSPAVEVTKAFLTSTQATRTYRDDDRARKFFVPKALLRLRLVPDVDYGLKSTRRSNRSRSAVQGAGANVAYYDLKDGARQRIAFACRALDAGM